MVTDARCSNVSKGWDPGSTFSRFVVFLSLNSHTNQYLLVSYSRIGTALHKLLNTNCSQVQYRMHPEISAFPRAEFYAGKVRDGPNVVLPSHKTALGPSPLIPSLGPFSFINVPDGWEEKEPGSTSTANPVEAAMAAALVRHLRNLMKLSSSSCITSADSRALSIGIISPYSGQVEAIMGRLGMKAAVARSSAGGQQVLGIRQQALFASEVTEGCCVELR
jgi:hypothetical protein